jgi:hypothetical protein
MICIQISYGLVERRLHSLPAYMVVVRGREREGLSTARAAPFEVTRVDLPS